MQAPPNIVYVFADQMPAHATGFNGNPTVKTPCLDRMAAESIDVKNAISTTPICTPYRASLLTGQYPLTHGLFLNDLPLGDNGETMGQVFSGAGYDTAYIGKWHLDGRGRSAFIPKERRMGFEYWKVLECTHDYNTSQYYDHDDDSIKEWDGYDVTAQTEDAVHWLKSRKESQTPFLLVLSFGPPHNPYDTAPEELKALYPPENMILRKNVPSWREQAAREQYQGFYAHVTAIDQSIGCLDQALCEAGLKENTIFVFTSDHGDGLESHAELALGQMGHRKQTPYEESIHVPFLLRWPRKFGNKPLQIETPMCSPDIFPTLLSLCGIPIPEVVEGEDVSARFHDGNQEERAVLIANYAPFADFSVQRGGRPYRGLRTKRYTYVRDLNGPWLLFDNQEDPFQLRNRVHDPDPILRQVQEQLEKSLDQLLTERGDSFERPDDLRQRFGYQDHGGQ